MKRLALLATAAVLATPQLAHAYNLLPGPIRWQDDGSGSSTLEWYIDPVATPPSMNAADVQPAMERSWQRWADLSCSRVNPVFMGDGAANERGYFVDGTSMVTFEDPNDDLGAGIYAANTQYTNSSTVLYNGLNFRTITETDTVFNTGWNFQTHDDIVANCMGGYNIESTATHEFGHGLGYAHSCESGEACTDPDEAEALMYWSGGACEKNSSPLIDDQRMNALVYGGKTMSEFSVSPDVGGLPLAVDFLIETFADATGVSAVWDYGDGAQETAADPTHTYTEEGKYTVEATISGTSPSCFGGDFTHTFEIPDAVLACPDPDPQFSYTVEGRKVTFQGLVEGQGLGCVTKVTWDFGDDTATAHTKNTIHEYASEGTYEVGFSAEGPAGVSEPFTQQITIAPPKGCKCSMAPRGGRAALGGSLLLALLAGLAVWRRRD